MLDEPLNNQEKEALRILVRAEGYLNTTNATWALDSLDARDQEIEKLKKELENFTCDEYQQRLNRICETANEASSLKAENERLVKERDEAINATVRKCAKAVCFGCRSEAPFVVTKPPQWMYHADGYGGCEATSLHWEWPEAFK